MPSKCEPESWAEIMEQQLESDIFILGNICPIEITLDNTMFINSYRSFNDSYRSTTSESPRSQKIHKVLKFEDFERIYRVIQKHV
jgi:hypothetical protein